MKLAAEGRSIVETAKRGFLSFGRAPGGDSLAGASFDLQGNFTRGVGRHKMDSVAEPAPEIQAVTLRVEIPADDPATPILYANNVGLTYSPHDMTLHFSWFAVPAVATPPAAGAQIDATVRLVGKISIPLSLVRPLAKLLDRQADAWEQSFNLTIPTPPGLRSPDPKQEADSVRSTE